MILAKVRQRKSDQRNSGRVLFIKETHCGCMLQDVGRGGEGKCSCTQDQTSGLYFIKERIQKEGLEPKVGKGAEKQAAGKGGVKMRGTKGTHKASD